MKRILLYCLFQILTFLLLIQSLAQEKITLDGYWKFKHGADTTWQDPDLNDYNWDNITLHSDGLEAMGYDYNGIVWYRKTFLLPSTILADTLLNRHIILRQIQMRDTGEVFLNGISLENYRIESSRVINSITDPYAPEYKIPVDAPFLQWDAQNTIAFRINHYYTVYNYTGLIGGGLVGEPPFIKVADDKDYLSVNIGDRFPKPCTKGQKHLNFTLENTAQKEISGKVQIKIFIKSKEADPLYENSGSFSLIPTAKGKVSFTVNIPELDDYFIQYEVINSANQVLDSHKQLLIYKEAAHQKMVKNSITAKYNFRKIKENTSNNLQFEGYLKDKYDVYFEKGAKQIFKDYKTPLIEPFHSRPGERFIKKSEGEFLGKMLSAAIVFNSFKKDAAFEKTIQDYIQILISSQDNDGYIGLCNNDFKWLLWDVKVHHLIIGALLDYYKTTGYEPALTMATKAGNIICSTFGPSKKSISDGFSFGLVHSAIIGSMADLYAYTSDKKYLEFCKYIVKSYNNPNGSKLIQKLQDNIAFDNIANRKAYEILSNLTGLAKYYSVSGDEIILEAMEKAWKDIIDKHLFLTGATSSAGYFIQDYLLPAQTKDWPGDACVTAEWINFNLQLYYVTAKSRYIDEVEKTLYNNAFGALRATDGKFSAINPLNGYKQFTDGLGCGTTSFQHAVAKIPEFIFSDLSEGGIAINLFTKSSFRTKIKTIDGDTIQLEIKVSTTFPLDGKVTIEVIPEKPATFKLAVRSPFWSKSCNAFIGGTNYFGEQGKYINIEKQWEKNESFEILMNMNARLINGGSTYRLYYAFAYGPMILAIDKALNNLSMDEFEKIRVLSDAEIQLFANEKVNQKKMIFTTSALIGSPENKEIRLLPYSETGLNGDEFKIWIRKK